jgi:hypothetical protein
LITYYKASSSRHFFFANNHCKYILHLSSIVKQLKMEKSNKQTHQDEDNAVNVIIN